MKIYPFQVPEDAHPLAFLFLGFGLDVRVINVLCRHLFDVVGVRFQEKEPVDVAFRYAVSQQIVPAGFESVDVGDILDVRVEGGDVTAVRHIGGHLPPGIRLLKHNGRLSGRFATPGLYESTFRVGTGAKYDPLGGDGSPDSPGEWIPWEANRYQPEPVAVPTSTDDLSPAELEDLIVQMREVQAAKLAEMRGD